jgi:DNA-binding CsgD family transcriptional regulator
MGFVHKTAPAANELTGSWTSAGPPAELTGRGRGSGTAWTNASRGIVPRSRPAARTAPDAEPGPRIALFVVRGQAAEAFQLPEFSLDAFEREIASTLAGTSPRAAKGAREGGADELSDAEARVLRYLPTSLTAREIADELFVSVNTVKTHMRHIYAKFDAHRRREAVERARVRGLLATRKHNDVAQGTNRSLEGSIPQRIDRGGMR